MSTGGAPAIKISAVISDVDGTLVTKQKHLTADAERAVAALRAQGIAFAIISSRPPRGLRMLTEPLGITAPMAGFNGGVLATPDGAVIEQHILPPPAARRAVDVIEGHGIAAWVFSGTEWLVRDPENHFVEREEHTVQFGPTVVDGFGSALDAAAKIVGVSDDAELLMQCESEVGRVLGDMATVARSQLYYLDITHRLGNKGDGVSSLSKLMGIPMGEIAVIGDGANDVAMFARAGLSIAMGNAVPEARDAADLVTDGNDNEGFAKAIDRFIIAGQRPGADELKQVRDRRGMPAGLSG